MSDDTPLTLAELKPGTAVSGVIQRLTLYGPLVDFGMDQAALLHISQLGHTNFRNVEEVFKVGELIEAFVLKVDKPNARVLLTMIKPPDVTWEAIRVGQMHRGKVVRLERFGAFVDIGAERPGMVHVSEMAEGYVESPEDVVKVGDEVEVRVIRVKRRQIDLSMKTAPEPIEVAAPADDEKIPTAMELALRRATGSERNNNAAMNRRAKNRRDDDDDIYSRTLRHHSGKK
jgi:ribosomal protein S1